MPVRSSSFQDNSAVAINSKYDIIKEVHDQLDVLGTLLTKEIYDSNNNGVVDNTEKVNNLTVETAVPAGAVFTDTVYDDTILSQAVALNTQKETNVSTDLSYNPSTREVISNDGTNAVLSLAGEYSGLMSAPDKLKLDIIEEGATADQTKEDIDALGINASTVNTKTVETSVPVDAVFSDTVYTKPSSEPIEYIEGLQDILHNKVEKSRVLTDVPVNAVFTDTVYNDSLVVKDTDFSVSGLMKTDGAGNYSVDGNVYLTEHQDISGKSDVGHTHNLLDLGEKSYSSLTDKPDLSVYAKLNGDVTKKFKVADAVEDNEALAKGQLLHLDKIAITPNGNNTTMQYNEITFDNATNDTQGWINFWDSGEGLDVMLRDANKEAIAGIKILDSGQMNKIGGKEIPDYQSVNIYIEDENNSYLLEENIAGDTDCGIDKVHIDGMIVEDTVLLSMRIKILDFSIELPTDNVITFKYDLLKRLKQSTDITGFYSDAFTMGTLDSDKDVPLIPVKVWIEPSAGLICASIEDSTNISSGGTAVTSTSFDFATTITFKVIRS